MSDRRPLLAGSFGPERVPSRRHPDEADWYLPLHLRDERGARDRLVAQVAAGADVVVAPTWLTHRRALLPLGETRRAAAWTRAGVRVARDAVELGLEHREEQLAEAPDDDQRRGRPRPLVAAVLPALDEGAEVETGRLLPHEAATARDYRDQAGLLAEAEPDLLLVEGQRAETQAHLAIGEAADTGLPVWAALSLDALAAADLEGWLEWSESSGVARLLLPPPLSMRLAAAEAEVPWAASVRPGDDATPWLEAGAGAVALLDGATPASIEPFRAAIDKHERAAIEAARAAGRRWLDHVARAATIAPRGAAVWIGDTPEAPLPDGFEWLVVAAAEASQLPAGHYRLVIACEGIATELGRLLEHGGVLAAHAADRRDADLRALVVDDSTAPALSIYRRES